MPRYITLRETDAAEQHVDLPKGVRPGTHVTVGGEPLFVIGKTRSAFHEFLRKYVLTI
jgi:hypothetical protein